MEQIASSELVCRSEIFVILVFVEINIIDFCIRKQKINLTLTQLSIEI